MAGAKEIRTKIKSIKNTQKITGAMEMVAASKMRKAQTLMAKSKPYAERIRTVIGHMACGQLAYQHEYTRVRPAKRVGFMVVSTDRGLCGGLNVNLFKSTLAAMETWREAAVAVDFCLIGNKAASFFKAYGANVLAQAGHLGDTPSAVDLVGGVKVMLDAFVNEELDRIYLCYNRFINTMVQTPVVEPLLPLPVSDDDAKAYQRPWDYLYEPDPKALLDGLMVRYIESQVYQAVVENLACEQAARMVAMKAASDNAGDLIDQFQLVYNKARQAAITQELSEIVAGAAAV